jgi:hypothetical protein
MNETSIEYGDHSDEIEQETASEMPEPSQWSTEASNTQTVAREDGSLSARNPKSTRRTVRRRFLQLLGSGIVVGTAGCSSNTGGGGGSKTAKAEVSYQDHPNQGQQCSGCQFYQPPTDSGNAGSCSKVKGKIAPDAWCSLYSPE